MAVPLGFLSPFPLHLPLSSSLALAQGAELLYDGIWRLGGVRQQQQHKLSETTAVCRVEGKQREGLGTPLERRNKPMVFC